MKYQRIDAGKVQVRFKSSEEYEEAEGQIRQCRLCAYHGDERFNVCRVEIIVNGHDTGIYFNSAPDIVEKLRHSFGAGNVKFIPAEPVTVPIVEYGTDENIERIADALERIAKALNQGR